MCRVSIVLPVRNAGATLRRAAASCLAQTFDDLELVIVDDASGDDTPQLISELCRGDARVSGIRLEEHGGVAVAAEAGRRAARGEFVARMDADDFSRPERIGRQVAYLDGNPDVAGCGTGVRLVGAPAADPGRGFGEHVRWLNSLGAPERMAAGRFIDSPIANPSSMVRAGALDAAGGHRDTEWAEDYDLWLRMFDAGLGLANLGEVLVDWHDSPGRLTRSDDRYSAANFSRAKAHYIAKLPQVAQAGVEIAGAGPIGKRLARDLIGEGVSVRRFYEVNPRRVGQRIAGVPVAGYAELTLGNAVLLGSVGLPGAREQIRALALAAGFREGHDFFPVA